MKAKLANAQNAVDPEKLGLIPLNDLIEVCQFSKQSCPKVAMCAFIQKPKIGLIAASFQAKALHMINTNYIYAHRPSQFSYRCLIQAQ